LKKGKKTELYYYIYPKERGGRGRRSVLRIGGRGPKNREFPREVHFEIDQKGGTQKGFS